MTHKFGAIELHHSRQSIERIKETNFPKENSIFQQTNRKQIITFLFV